MRPDEDPSAKQIEAWRTIYTGVVARFIHSDGQGWQIPAFGVIAQAVLLAAAADQQASVAAAFAIGSMAIGTGAIFMLLDHKLATNTDQLILHEIELLILDGDDTGVMTGPTPYTPFVAGSERFAAMRKRYPDRLSLRRGLMRRWSPHWWAVLLIGLLIVGGFALFLDALLDESEAWLVIGLGLLFLFAVVTQAAARLVKLWGAEKRA